MLVPPSQQSKQSSVGLDTLTQEHPAEDPLIPTPPPPAAAIELPLPQQIRHFTVLRQLGRGGMGVVLSAYDNELDRKVAIKLLHRAGGDTEGRARLQREAQAMAKLTHPNIARVYEAGEVDGRVYIVMEFIQGVTLRAWLRRKPPWREVLATMLQAGRGLAAAHAAGLIHRDFKPDNVMVGDDGFVRVLDFGLARAIGGAPPAPRPASERPAAPVLASYSSLSEQLTEAGTRVGTPQYMSPEQFALQPVGVTSDQFSFCVALFEGLYGTRPFKARTAEELVAQIEELQAVEPPRGSKVPRRLWPIVLRGLAVRPEERWPSMQALLAELSREPGKRLRDWLAGVAIAAATAGLSYGLVAPDTTLCKTAASKFDGIWGEARKAEIREAFRATGAAHADVIADRVELRLDDYVGRWIAMHTEACEATHIRGEQSAQLLDRRMECLELRRAEVDELVRLYTAADADTIGRALQALGSLSRLDRCADAEALMSTLPPPDDPDQARRIAAVRERLARLSVRGYLVLPSYKVMRPIVDELLRESKEIGYLPLLAEVLLREVALYLFTGDTAAAERTLLDAYFTAGAVGHTEVQAAAAIDLVYLVGSELGRFEEAMLWDRHAGMLLGRLGPRPKLEYERHSSLAGTLQERGKLAEAREHYERALAIISADEGPASLAAVVAATNLGNVLLLQDDLEGAEKRFRLALGVFVHELGPETAAVAAALSNLAVAVRMRGDLVESRELAQRALAIYEEQHGPEHPALLSPLLTLGLVALDRREFVAARDLLTRALAIEEQALGPDDLELLEPLAALTEVAVREGRLDDAEALAARALGIHERAEDPAPGLLLPVLDVLGQIALARGEHDAARRHYQRALELSERIHGADHSSAVQPRAGLARVALAEAQTQQAIAQLTRALATLEARPSPAHTRAELRFALAQALHAASDPGARETARKALADFAAAGEPFAGDRAEVESWLAQHKAGALSRTGP